MKRKLLLIHVAAALCVFPLMQTFAQQHSITIEIVTTFEYPDYSRATYPAKINEAGDIAGTFYDEHGVIYGFVRFHNGTFSSPIKEPKDNLYFTHATGINSSHTLCGWYETKPDYVEHGFFLSGGTFTEFDDPDGISTFLWGLNDAGNFCGQVWTSPGGDGPALINIGGTTTLFTVGPGVSNRANGINNLNQCVGSTHVSNSGHGFLRDPDGALTFPIDVPTARFTTLEDINDLGWMVGQWITTSFFHAVVFETPEKFVTYDYPGAVNTIFNGINNRGLISGYWDDGSGNQAVGIVARVSRTPAN